MASIGIKNREAKRVRLVARYDAKRKVLLGIISDAKASDDDRLAARLQLQRLPRNANPVRLRNRCMITGRPRGVFRKFKLCRNLLRDMAMRGEVPGMTKASW